MNADMIIFIALAALATLAFTLTVCRPLAGQAGKAGANPGAPRGRWLAAGSAMAIPLAATLLYGALGSPRMLSMPASAPIHRMNAQDMSAATARLAQRLQAQPDDLEGWVMLARSHQAMAAWQPAAEAYRRAIKLAPGDAQLMADLADVLATAQNGSLEGEPARWIRDALALDPRHPKGLALAAMSAYRQGDLVQAQAHWATLARHSPADSQAASLARQGLARIQQLGAAERPRPR